MINADGNKGMERGIEYIKDIIDDILQAPKHPDGTLKEEDKIINNYLEKFDEVFEDELEIENHGENAREDILLDKQSLVDLIRKYFSMGIFEFRSKVKISAKKGKIVIERIK